MAKIFHSIFKTAFIHRRCFNLMQIAMREMPDALELITGLQKKEIEALRGGNSDPFNIKVVKRGSNTKENPTLIPSAFNARIVGCICKDNRFVNYMWLEKGSPKRCECGHWYKLYTVEGFSRGF